MLERIKDVGLLELPLRKMSNVDLLKLLTSSKAMAKGEIGAEIERILTMRLRGEIVAEPGRRVSLVRWLVPDRLLAVAGGGGGRSTVEFWRVGSGAAPTAAAEAAGNIGMEFGSPVRDILYRGGYLAVVEQNGPVRLWRMAAAAAAAAAGAAAPEYIGEVADIEQPRDGVVAAAWFLGDRRIGVQIDTDFCVFGFGGRGSGSSSRPFRLLGELSGEFNTTFHPLSDTAIIENEGPELLALPGSSSGSRGRGGTLRIWDIVSSGVEFRHRTTFKLPANYGRSFEVVSGGPDGGFLATSEHFISEPGEDKIVLWDCSSEILRRIRELSPRIPVAAYASDATKSRIGPMRFVGTYFAAAAAGGIHIWPGPASDVGGPADGFPVQFWTTTQKSGSRPRRTRRNYVDFAWGKKVLATAHSHGIDLWNLPELLGETRSASSAAASR